MLFIFFLYRTRMYSRISADWLRKIQRIQIFGVCSNVYRYYVAAYAKIQLDIMLERRCENGGNQQDAEKVGDIRSKVDRSESHDSVERESV